jgi:hypothetical protein
MGKFDGKEDKMLKLSWWEEFVVGAAVSFLTVLEAKIQNPTELAALQAAVDFLKKLLGGGVSVVAPAAPLKDASSTTSILD